MSEVAKPRRNPWVVAVLIILPVWLIVSAGAGLWIYYRNLKKEEMIEPSKFATPIETERLADDLRKLVDIIGERHIASQDGMRGLRRASSMIQGALGPGNAGYRVDLEKGTRGDDSPIIVATLPGGDAPAIWIVTGYDTRGGGVEANSSGVASALAVARSVAGEKPLRPIKFAFLPHAYDVDAPVLPLLDEFTKLTGTQDLVLVVEAMGAKGELMISSRDAKALARPAFAKHGTIVGAEAVCLEDDFDLASILFELGQPAVRMATREVVGASEKDTELPDPAEHAAATLALADLVMELAK